MSANYRIYWIDGAGHVLGVDWVEAENDEQALAAARSGEPGKREIWLRDRLVGTIRVESAEEGSAAYWL